MSALLPCFIVFHEKKGPDNPGLSHDNNWGSARVANNGQQILISDFVQYDLYIRRAILLQHALSIGHH